ncbi:predicted protein [Aspergillus nidulans FGSC A4]|uniref:BTB domain-containing protein n=1 Tax=Emericella nidulans (strain FGSC A4 / ATCC 38163 / CBS 112.46 / NRRL 194 / M139) TaxID=227321 RepID=Q5B0E3_EMENI|nr:hypothetical protein [Aspergillus nidulans FGSC A4]EAA57736.1 predicted protein [Aspergillus nidulans FGSC A4]CBF70412.1 TPA: conserved hypothetical protein [Aspergillus nidulans FGSC A4]|eukprot:XP_663591.1 predicted protein [Aspergillus nidulans FGSC A4]
MTSSEFGPELGDIVEEYVLPQVDGTVARRKVKRMEKSRKKKKKRRRRRDEEKESTAEEDDNENVSQERNMDGDRDVSEVEVDVQARQDREEERPLSRDSGVFIVHGNRGVKSPGPEPEIELQQQRLETLQGEQRAELEVRRDDGVVCRIHYRPECQFHRACCVHKPVVSGCGCPPRWSCCCIHHAGDCCHCQTKPVEKSVSVDADADAEEESKTLSLGSSPATPPPERGGGGEGEGEGKCEPNTTTIAASAATPEKPSGVEVRVTPPSPTASQTIEPVRKMGGAEDTKTLAQQAAFELSNALIQMMECSHMSDITLTLQSANEQFWPIVMTAHKCVLARSPLVTNILKNDHACSDIKAFAGRHFTMIKAWEQAVHYLYGRNMLTMTTLKPATLEALGYDPYPGYEPEYPFSLKLAMADMALGYAVSGAFFYMTDLADRGFRLALDLLSWETLEQILYFGLRTGDFCVVFPNPPWLQGSDTSLKCDRLAQGEGEAGEASDKTRPKPNNTASQGAENAAAASQNPAREAQPPYPIPLIKNDWSRRIITASLAFVVENIKPDFKLDCSAQSKIVPDRIPAFLKTVPVTTAADRRNTPVKVHGDFPYVPVTTVPATSSATVANNPRLADVQFGSLPSQNQTAIEEIHKSEREKCAARHTPHTPTPRSKKSPPASSADVPGKEITIPSAILLALDYPELQFVFSMLSRRGVMTSTLAQAIVLERETRRRQALRNYAALLLSSNSKGKHDTVTVLARPAGTEGVGVGAVTLSTEAPTTGGSSPKKGRPKGKARKAAKEAKEAAKDASKEFETATATVVHLPDDVRELCYREFFISKLVGGSGRWDDDESGQVEIEIVLERYDTTRKCIWRR